MSGSALQKRASMLVCMWVHIKLSCSAYVAEIYEVQEQAGGQAEGHCLLEQKEQPGPLNTLTMSIIGLHAEAGLHHSFPY